MENDTTPSNETPDVEAQAAEQPTEKVTETTPTDTASAPTLTPETTPVTEPQASLPAETHESTPRSKLSAVLVAVVATLMLLIGLGAGYAAAQLATPKVEKTVTQLPAPQQNTDKELTVPEGATVIAECAKGRGKQYVLPKDIPQGPVYNVYNGKVIGIEYMLGQQDVLSSKDYLDLPLQGVKYDHINIGLLSKGHSGYPDPHYHVDVFTISHEEAAKITCQ